MPIQHRAGSAVDVKRQHQNAQVAAGAPERSKQLVIARLIAAAVGMLTARIALRPEFGVTLEDGKAQKQEHRKSQQPERQAAAYCCSPGDNPYGIQGGEHHYVQHCNLFQSQGIGERQDEVAGQHQRELSESTTAATKDTAVSSGATTSP